MKVYVAPFETEGEDDPREFFEFIDSLQADGFHVTYIPNPESTESLADVLEKRFNAIVQADVFVARTDRQSRLTDTEIGIAAGREKFSVLVTCEDEPAPIHCLPNQATAKTLDQARDQVRRWADLMGIMGGSFGCTSKDYARLMSLGQAIGQVSLPRVPGGVGIVVFHAIAGVRDFDEKFPPEFVEAVLAQGMTLRSPAVIGTSFEAIFREMSRVLSPAYTDASRKELHAQETGAPSDGEALPAP